MAITIFYNYKWQDEKSIKFDDAEELIIGRKTNKPVDIDLSFDTKVSRSHARLKFENGVWWLEDLGSRHGVFYQNQRVQNPIELPPYEQFQIGETVLWLEYVGEVTDLALPAGHISQGQLINETLPSSHISEAERIGILSKISATFKKEQGIELFHSLLLLLKEYTQADNLTIAKYDQKQLIPITYYPKTQSFMTGFHWLAANTDTYSESLKGVVSAIYAPMIYNRQTIGVIHITKTGRKQIPFTDGDVEFLSEFATTLAMVMNNSELNIRNNYPSVFVSYAHKDQDIVEKMINNLRRSQVRVWYDKHLDVGDIWEQELLSAIEQMDGLVLVMTETSLSSPYVKMELNHARALGKKIFPVLAKDCHIPGELSRIQYIDIRSAKNMDELISAIYRLRSQDD